MNFFTDGRAFRVWLEAHHENEKELWVAYYKKGTGKPSLTWPESVDEALCYGWIDGLRKGIDEISYKIRFTPRKPSSIWSAVNIERVRVLTEQGLMQEAGLQAFAIRKEAKSGIYSYEQEQPIELDGADEEKFRANPQAWAYFQKQTPTYRKTATWWINSAKRDETKISRLSKLIALSDLEETLPHLTRPSKK